MIISFNLLQFMWANKRKNIFRESAIKIDKYLYGNVMVLRKLSYKNRCWRYSIGKIEIMCNGYEEIRGRVGHYSDGESNHNLFFQLARWACLWGVEIIQLRSVEYATEHRPAMHKRCITTTSTWSPKEPHQQPVRDIGGSLWGYQFPWLSHKYKTCTLRFRFEQSQNF